MNSIETGMFAKSKVGHDRGKCYVITGIANDVILLSDGEGRPFENPKLKKKKHLQIDVRKKQFCELPNQALVTSGKIDVQQINQVIKNALKAKEEIVNV